MFLFLFHRQREISAHAAIYARNSVQTQRLTKGGWIVRGVGARWVNSYDMQPEAEIPEMHGK